MRNRLGTLFDIRGLGWQVLIPLAFILLGAVGIGSIVFWQALRDALSDFLTADVQVWHLLLAVGATIGVGLVIVWLLRRSLGGVEGTGAGFHPYASFEVEQFGVMWPITPLRTGGLGVGQPMCKRDRSTLVRILLDKFVSLDRDWATDMTAPDMEFICPKEGCGARYDLTGHKRHMFDLLNLVRDVAQGTYWSRSEAARREREKK